MKKEIVKIRGKFAARYKRWYYFNWVYISIAGNTYYERTFVKDFCLVETQEEAEIRISSYFGKVDAKVIKVIK